MARDSFKVAEEQNRAVVGDVPDSRAREKRGQIQTPYGLATPVYCANCGKFSGYVFGDITMFFWLCADCDKFGNGLDLPVVDESFVRDLAKGGT